MGLKTTKLVGAGTLLVVPLLAATQLSSSAPEALAGRDPGRGVDQPPWNGNGIGVDTGRVVEIRSAGIELAFDVTEIEATAGETLTIRFINASDMAHNVVLLKAAEDIQLVGEASWRAHANDWVPEREIDRIVAHTAVAGPGEDVEVTFTVPPPGTYPFICTYSGHWTTMQGRLISTEPDESSDHF